MQTQLSNAVALPDLSSTPAPVRLLDQVRERVRYLRDSLRIEPVYVHWVRAFVRFHGLRHPQAIGRGEVEAVLSWLAAERQVSVSSHRQALAALLFLYKQALGHDLNWIWAVGRRRTGRLSRRPPSTRIGTGGLALCGDRAESGCRPSVARPDLPLEITGGLNFLAHPTALG